MPEVATDTEDEERRGPGRPPHEPTDEMRAKIRNLARVESIERTAEIVGISKNTLTKYYQESYDAGKSEAVSAVKAKLLAQAMAGNVNAAWKYLVLQGEVKPIPRRVEHTGADGGPIEFVDLTRLTDEQLELYGRLAATAAGLDPDALIVEYTDR